jgi:hypothetical protein
VSRKENQLRAYALIRAIGNQDREAFLSLMPDVDQDVGGLIIELATAATVWIKDDATSMGVEFDYTMDALVRGVLTEN